MKLMVVFINFFSPENTFIFIIIATIIRKTQTWLTICIITSEMCYLGFEIIINC
jgi:hypothetical protein